MTPLLEAFAALFVLQLLTFVLCVVKKNNGLVDIIWGLGIVLGSWVLFLNGPVTFLPAELMIALLSIWGLRLSYHLFRRNWGKPEDARYGEWRKAWGKSATLRSFFQITVLQSLLQLLMLFPMFALLRESSSYHVGVLGLGAFIWVFGFVFEAVGDAELRSFVRTKKTGEIMTKGLWAYTRHPNYFGEITQWWGLAVVALSASGAWIALISPLLITLLIRYVSGVPLLEKKYEGNPQWEAYKKRVSVLIPWFPKGA